jgi:hypothetical protein
MPEATPVADVMQEFDAEFLLGAPEIYIFSACRHILELLGSAEGPASRGTRRAPVSDERRSGLLAQLCGLAEATERFDIVAPLIGEAIFSPFFWRWFNWWHDYRQGMAAQELERVHRLQEAWDLRALKYRPPGHWLRYRATPPSGLKLQGLARRGR